MSAPLRAPTLLAAAALGLALLAGCEPAAPTAPPIDRPPPDDPTMNALHRAWLKVHTERTVLEGVLAVPGADEEALARVERRWAEARVSERLPLSFDEAALASSVRAVARAQALVLSDVRLEPLPDEAPTLPTTLEPGAPFPVTPALALRAARCELELALEGTPDERAKLQRFFEALPEEGPLLHVRSLRLEKGRAIFVADCWALRTFDPPPHYRTRRLSLEALVKAEGLDELPAPEAATAASRARALVEVELFHLEAIRPMADAALVPRSLVALREVRLAAFEEKRAAAAAVTFAQLLP